MKKVKYFKTKNKTIEKGVCVCLDDSLFLHDTEASEMISCLMNMLSSHIKQIDGTVWVDQNTAKVLETLPCTIDSDPVVFGKSDTPIQISFENSRIFEMVSFIFLYDLTFSGSGCNDAHHVIATFAINDHDGTYVTIDRDVFQKEYYKQRVNDLYRQNHDKYRLIEKN